MRMNKQMEEQFQVLESMCEQFGFYCNTYGNGSAYVKSKIDEWIIEVESDKIYLKHGNNRAKKARYHKQREFSTMDYLVMSIHTHDLYKTTGKDVRVTSDCKLIERKSKIWS